MRNPFKAAVRAAYRRIIRKPFSPGSYVEVDLGSPFGLIVGKVRGSAFDQYSVELGYSEHAMLVEAGWGIHPSLPALFLDWRVRLLDDQDDACAIAAWKIVNES